MTEIKKLTTNAGAPVVDNQNTMTAGPRGPVLLQDVRYLGCSRAFPPWPASVAQPMPSAR